ncbi:PilN domain-containing protein [Massilia niastensis]|uniref:PilN domain-containing protein n=1 Tax=Massilia niastensis TaxID=544911 RepID=UPI00036BF56F|nr:PilN domain-containing protein [Massilia niastensis]
MSQQINLFNPVFQPQKKILSAATMALALAVLVAGIAALAVFGQARTAAMREEASAGAARLQQKQARLATVNAEFAPRQKNGELVAEIAEADAQLAALRNISGVIERGELGDTNGFGGYFKALARQSVQGLWLTGVSVARAGNEIGIKGRTLDPAMVPGYLNRLTREPLMQDKSFASLQIGEAAPLPGAAVEGKPASTPAPYVEFSLQSAPEEARK